MPDDPLSALLTADTDLLRQALDEAEVPALMPAVATLTGDMAVLRDEFRPNPAAMLEPEAGLSPETIAEARAVALETLVRWREAGARPAPAPDADHLRAMLEFTVGGEVTDRYVPLFREELGLAGDDLRAPAWNKHEVAPGRPFVVGVIGAGMSGLLAAYRLRQAGIDVVVLDKNDDVGGTWLDNTYPGCRVDVSNHFYSYSFAQRDDWPQHFSTQDVLLDYFRQCADDFGVRPFIRFGTEVTAATWGDDRGSWTLQLCTADGDDTLEVQALVSAVGQLNVPKYPDIDGIDRFEGPAFHSARWRHDVDLTGKRVAVIGTGASAAQLIPAIAGDVAELTVFQRTPNWLIPTPEYYQDVSAHQHWLHRHLPSYAQWMRFWLFWRNCEGMLPLVRVDPDWQPRQTSVSAENDFLRLLLTEYLTAEFGDDPDLLAKVLPTYPPSAKRLIRDDGIWARTLKRDNVELVTEKIDEITGSGVRTADGVEHEVDVIVYGTGFQASKFLTPMRVVGRDGIDLHEQWHGDARAYLGITVPHFPNFFCLYGPNTNIVINGSIIYFSECEVDYLLHCLRLLLQSGGKAIDCRPEVHDAYNQRIDQGNLQMVWGVATVNSWYRNEFGRVAQNWPFSLLEYWEQTRAVDAADYDLIF